MGGSGRITRSDGLRLGSEEGSGREMEFDEKRVMMFFSFFHSMMG